MLYNSLYIGVEIKLPKGSLTPKQKETLPELINKGNIVYIAESVIDIFDIIEHINNNVIILENKDVLIKSAINNLPEMQQKYRNKYKLPLN